MKYREKQQASLLNGTASVLILSPVRFVNWMRIPDAASAHSNWMQQSDVVRSRFWKFWIMRLEIVSGYSIGRQFSFKTEFTNL